MECLEQLRTEFWDVPIASVRLVMLRGQLGHRAPVAARSPGGHPPPPGHLVLGGV